MTPLTIYDGVESIGGNKIHVEEGGRALLLNFCTTTLQTLPFYIPLPPKLITMQDECYRIHEGLFARECLYL